MSWDDPDLETTGGASRSAIRVDFWERQIDRALKLIDTVAGANELLSFYVHLLRAQEGIYKHFQNREWVPSGDLAGDVTFIRPAFPEILEAVHQAGPPPLVEQARALQSMDANHLDHMLLTYWHEPSDTEFFAKAFLQPYGQYIAQLMTQTEAVSERRCPHCFGKPQLSILQNKEPGAESGNRDLMCAKCLSVWPFRRAVCAHCGEEDPAKLAFFQAVTHEHVRVEACDTCKHYLKGVDLTRMGHAQPLVDEVAAAPLDLWATEHGYTKIELNLVGL